MPRIWHVGSFYTFLDITVVLILHMIQILLLCVTEADNLRLLVPITQTILQVSAIGVDSVESVLDGKLVPVCRSYAIENLHLCALLSPATDG